MEGTLEQFREHVREALAHLYDHQYLETHPLSRQLGPSRPGETRGQCLHRILLDAIQALKPEPDLPYESLAWRKYRYLYLRYVQVLRVPEIASDLGISLRQSRRYSLEALAAVTHILLDRRALAAGNGADRLAPRPRRSTPAAAPRSTPSAEDDGASMKAVRPLSAVDQEIARMESRSQEAVAPVRELLEGVIVTIRPLAERRGIELRAPAGDVEPIAAIERAAFRQALLSVLSQGLEVGSASIELATRTSLDSDRLDGEIVVSIRLGFGEEVRPGLVARLVADERWHIAEHLLQSQGGRLAVQPPRGRQLVVDLGLPMVRRSKVLVVEDNPDAIQLYTRFLTNSPYSVLSAIEGAAALTSAERDQPAVILLDVMMPARDGWEILQILKSNPETQRIPVLVCSVLKERELALALGAADFLVKPVSRASLVQALERSLTSRLPAEP